MTDSVVQARLCSLQKRLTEPTPAPLDGQETIDLNPAPRYEQPALDEETPP